MVILEQLLNTGNYICGLSNAASSTVAKRVLISGSTDEAAIFLILIGLEGVLLPLTELLVHRAILRVRLINLMSQLVCTQI
jgi:hypothetical protein